MKNNLSLIFIFFLSYSTYSQFDFQSDNPPYQVPSELEATVLRSPDFDSLIFEMRFFNSANLVPFVQITFDKNHHWNYRKSGSFNNNYHSETIRDFKFDSLWNVCVNLNLLDLPDQDSLTYLYWHKQRMISMSPKDYSQEGFVHDSGNSIYSRIELFTRSKSRKIHYLNAYIISNAMKTKSGWQSPETEQFAEICQILSDYFQLMEPIRKD